MNYLECFSSNVREMPRFMGLAEAVIRQAEDLRGVVRAMGVAFSEEYGVGVQLDWVGAAMGINRPGGMADSSYRELIRKKLRVWRWNGTNEEVAGVLDDIDPDGAERDNDDLTVTIVPSGEFPREAGYPVPAGVTVCRGEEEG